MSSIEKTLLNEVRTQLRHLDLREGDSLCVGFSGGPDSTALLLLLDSLRRETGFSLHVVYVEHGIRNREEREGEMRSVILTTERLKVPLYTQCLPEGLLREESAFLGGLEAAARIRRFVFLEKIRDCTGSRAVALAHTADDQVETMLMRVFQGAGVEGLTGMKVLEGTVFRPLLEVSKGQLLKMLTLKNTTYSVDSTNYSSDHLRNSIRQKIVPAILGTFPSLNSSLEQFAGKMRSVMEVLELNSPDQPVPTEGEGKKGLQDGFHYDHQRFFALPLYYRIRLVYQLYNSWYPEGHERLPYGFLLELCGRPSSDHRHLYGSGHGLRMEKIGRGLFWSRVVVHERKKRYLSVVQPGLCRIGNSLRCRVFSDDSRSGKTKFSSHGSFELLSGAEDKPCVFRSRREGDSIVLTSGQKRIKSLLNDIGASEDEEYQVVILEDRRGILAVVVLKGIYFRVISGSYSKQKKPGATTYTFEFE